MCIARARPPDVARFKRLLDHNKQAKIVWAHAGTDPIGTRNPTIQRELLTRHPNLYMSLRVGGRRKPPTFALDESLTLKPAWLALLKDFPDCFVIGSDFFHTSGGPTRGPKEESLGNYQLLIKQLPPDVAAAIAYGNAERIYRLPAIGK